jgi:hypothetical protein
MTPKSQPDPNTPLQYLPSECIAFLGLFLTSFAWWYNFLRYLANGVRITAVMNAPIIHRGYSRKQGQGVMYDIPGSINNFITRARKKKLSILYIVNPFWFLSTGELKNMIGKIICLCFAFVTSCALWTLIGKDVGLFFMNVFSQIWPKS